MDSVICAKDYINRKSSARGRAILIPGSIPSYAEAATATGSPGTKEIRREGG